MTTTAELALLALRAYSTPWAIDPNPEIRDTEKSRPAVPAGWIEREWNPDQGDGFSYGVYQNGADIVISYAGSNQWVDWVSDITAAAGVGSTQITKSAIAYLQAQKQYGNNITLTGHSLGGGLASVMSVWFNRPAVVFSEAPFKATAVNPIVMGAVAKAMQLAGYTTPALTELLNGSISAYTAREAKVSNYHLEGEFMEGLRATLPTVLGAGGWGLGAGQDNIIKANINDHRIGPITLHSQELLTAFLMSEEFRQATYISKHVIPIIMDENFYGGTTQERGENAIISFIRSEQGTGDKITHFSADLRKIGANIAVLNDLAQQAIIAQAIEWYYWQKKDYDGKEFFIENSANLGIIQYTTAIGSNLTGAKNAAFMYTRKWFDTLYKSNGHISVRHEFDQWNWTTGNEATTLSATDANKSQIFIGGAGPDNFTGGSKNDVIFGGSGDDTLLGGIGTDIYRFRNMWGDDTITDSDGAGSIEVDGIRLQGGRKVRDQAWINEEQGLKFTMLGSGKFSWLSISQDGKPGQIRVSRWKNGQLGLTMDESQTPETTGVLSMSGKDINIDQSSIVQVPSANVVLLKPTDAMEKNISGKAPAPILTGNAYDWELGNYSPPQELRPSNSPTLLDNQTQNLVSAMASFSPPAPSHMKYAANHLSLPSQMIAAHWQ